MSDLRHKTIGDVLLERKLISPQDLERAQHMQQEVGGLMSQALLRLGSVAEDDLLIAQSERLGLPIITTEKISESLEDYTRAQTTLGLTSSWLLARDCALWQTGEGEGIHMLARNILAPELREQIERQCARANLELKDYICGNQTLDMALFYIRDDSQAQNRGLSLMVFCTHARRITALGLMLLPAG